jgi:hypothetical protein
MRIPSVVLLVVVLHTGCDLSFGQTPAQRAWDTIEKGHDSHSTKERVNAVRALGLLPGDSRAEELAEELIRNKRPKYVLQRRLPWADSARVAPFPY